MNIFLKITSAKMNICPKLHFPEKLFSRIYTYQNVHLAETTFPRKLIFQKLHLPEFTLAETTFLRKFIFQILYTLNQNFVIDRIYITKVYNYACSFSKFIELRVE